jgi:tRNA1(Val) A37 N6-methylase TrmN6
LGRRFGAVEIIPLWPRQGEAAKRVIVRARKDRQTPCTLHPGLVLHEAGGSYTPETDGILRDMAPPDLTFLTPLPQMALLFLIIKNEQ